MGKTPVLTNQVKKESQTWGGYVAFFAVVVVGYGIALVGVLFDSGWNPSPLAIAASLAIGVL